jgi:predicted acyltransferase
MRRESGIDRTGSVETASSRIKAAFLWPWLVFGSNAIVAYCVAELLIETLWAIKVSAPVPMSLVAWIYLHVFSHGDSTRLTSLAFALAYVAVCFLPNYLLWHKRIFVKI